MDTRRAVEATADAHRRRVRDPPALEGRLGGGTFVPRVPVKPGDRIAARFDPIGTVTARLASPA